MKIRLTEAQVSALECAGVFEGEDPIAPFITDTDILATQESAALVCELSNHLDTIGNGHDERDEERRKWYRHDARVLGNLYSKLLLAAHKEAA